MLVIPIFLESLYDSIYVCPSISYDETTGRKYQHIIGDIFFDIQISRAAVEIFKFGMRIIVLMIMLFYNKIDNFYRKITVKIYRNFVCW